MFSQLLKISLWYNMQGKPMEISMHLFTFHNSLKYTYTEISTLNFYRSENHVKEMGNILLNFMNVLKNHINQKFLSQA